MPSMLSELLGSRKTWISRTGHHRSSKKSDLVPILTNVSHIDYDSTESRSNTYCSDKAYHSPAGTRKHLDPDKRYFTLSHDFTHLPPATTATTTTATGIYVRISNKNILQGMSGLSLWSR